MEIIDGCTVIAASPEPTNAAISVGRRPATVRFHGAHLAQVQAATWQERGRASRPAPLRLSSAFGGEAGGPAQNWATVSPSLTVGTTPALLTFSLTQSAA